MKVYPKIPRYDHPVVPSDFFKSSSLTITEKFDGSSFRFTLYDERYKKHYPDQVKNKARSDGCLVFGTRKTIRGSHRDSLSDIDGALHRAVRCLRESIDIDKLYDFHYEFDCPLIIYAENLVYSTLDYGYTKRNLPALIGFDVLPYTEIDSMTPPDNPYEETFEGFLDIETAYNVLDGIIIKDVPTELSFIKATIIEEKNGFDPDTYEFPNSSLSENIKVEGIVIRDENKNHRVKLVRDKFKELNREQFGIQPEYADSGAEYIVAKYCTPARIRKQIRKMVTEEGYEFGLDINDDLYPKVVKDIWEENWQEIMRLDISFKPADIYPIVAKRCIEELRKMKKNAELNDTDPTKIWQHLFEK